MSYYTKYFEIIKTKWFIAIGCLILGAVIILGIRFFTYKIDNVHYHANFALYIGGIQEQFSGAQYYSDVEMCSVSTAMTPQGRAHMHDNINNVVHIEDRSVTWGQFFTNLGWTLGPNFIQSPNGKIYIENGDQKLNIIIGGQDYTDLGNMANTVINDQDRLLVSYGMENTADLMKQYNAIPHTAHHYDITKDPATCSGNHGFDMHDRLVHIL